MGLAQKQVPKTAKNEHPDRWIAVVIGTLKGQFDQYFNSPAPAGGGGLGEGERIYPLGLYARSSILYPLYPLVLYPQGSVLYEGSPASTRLGAQGPGGYSS